MIFEKTRFLILFSLFLLIPLQLNAQTLKKISMSSNDNRLPDRAVFKLIYPDSINTTENISLKKYVLENASFKAKNEPEIFFELMSWVSSRWPHDGWNEAPDTLSALDILKNAEKGEKYRCVEYGRVLRDILLAFGYISRTVGLKSADVAYGGAGKGHVAAEVWSDNLGKWIFLDPQFGVYARYVNTPLNIYEIFYMKKDHRFDEISFVSRKQGEEKINSEYGSFLTNYLGYMDIRQKYWDKHINLTLKLEGKEEYLTFQGFPSGGNIFTDKESDLYFDVNRVAVLVDFSQDEYKRVGREYEKCAIKTEKDFVEKMYLFAARPDLKLTFLNNMPWFDHYEAFIDVKKVTIRDGECSIRLSEGTSKFTVYPVNQAGVKGIPTVLEFTYR